MVLLFQVVCLKLTNMRFACSGMDFLDLSFVPLANMRSILSGTYQLDLPSIILLSLYSRI